VDDLRLLSLADAGELSLTCEPTDAKILLERVLARHAVSANQHNIDLQVQVEPDLPQIDVDMERMSQVLDNLVLNAFRYTPEGGMIILAADEKDGNVQIHVKDTGRGISGEDIPHIFDRFFRGDKSRQQSGESGLGLAIAKSLVEAHGGKISVVSTPGEGAEFTITLSPYSGK
jgi:two-component system sensor histidine kinase BaeS